MPRIGQINHNLGQNTRRPPTQHKHTLGQVQRLLDIVRHQERREALALP